MTTPIHFLHWEDVIATVKADIDAKQAGIVDPGVDPSTSAAFWEWCWATDDAAELHFDNRFITLATDVTTFKDREFGDVSGIDFYVDEYIYHDGDTDTRMRFQADQWTLTVGGVTVLNAVEGASDYLTVGVPMRSAYGLWDSDGDTGIQVEEGADDDTIRLDAAGTEVATLTSALTTLNTDLTVTGDITGANLNISEWDTAYGWGDHAGLYADVTHADSHHSGGSDALTFSSIAGFGTYLNQAVKTTSAPTFAGGSFTGNVNITRTDVPVFDMIRTSQTSLRFLCGATAYGAGVQSPNKIFLTANNDATDPHVVINTDGSVAMSDTLCIGTASPDGTLHVHTASAGTVTAHADADDLVVENSGNVGLTLLTADDQLCTINFGDESDNNVGYIVFDHADNSMDLGATVLNYTGATVYSVKTAGGAGGTEGSPTSVSLANTSHVTVDPDGTDGYYAFTGHFDGQVIWVKNIGSSAWANLPKGGSGYVSVYPGEVAVGFSNGTGIAWTVLDW